MIVLGAGVIACEYASVFASLGVDVTIVDRGERPLVFVDAELTALFQEDFEAAGGRYLGGRTISRLQFDGVSKIDLELSEGETISAEKVFVALGRSGCLETLDLDACGLVPTSRGALEVDDRGATAVPGIYAVGDVAGPPALATSAMEQGRRAVLHALDLPTGRFGAKIPTGIYTIPELASVGATESEILEQGGEVAVGRARFEELARGQIMGLTGGLLKIVASPDDGQILGVHSVGEGSTELIHVGQMALIAGAKVDDLIENVFNFPTLTEAYRVAALDCANRIEALEKETIQD
jgi:NAD(P) transhydrogenase